MKDYFRAFSAELLKLRRTPALWVVLATPTVICGLWLAVGLKMEKLPSAYPDGWEWVIRNITLFWGVMLLPMLIALLSGLLNAIEHGAESWKHLFALPVSKSAVYSAKFTLHHLLLILTSALLILDIYGLGCAVHFFRPTFGFSYDAPLADLAVTMTQMYLASWLILGFLHYLATRVRNFTVTLGVGIAGTFVGMVQATGWWQKLFPFKLPMNTQAAIPGVPELALAIGALGGLILTVLAIVDLSRRETL